MTRRISWLAGWGLLLLAACTWLPGRRGQKARVEGTYWVQQVQVEVSTAEARASVRIQGMLSNPCLIFPEVQVNRSGHAFVMVLQPQFVPGTACPEQRTPFTLNVPLDLHDLPAGTYQVVVGDKIRTFAWPGIGQGSGVPTSTLPAVEPAPGATATPLPGARIQGEVWADTCTVTGGEGGTPVVPGPGCVRYDQGYASDGLRQPGEAGLAGLTVHLARGACPGAPFAQTQTDAQGRFTFTVEPGTYCVSISESDPANRDRLRVGMWIRPTPGGEGRTTVTVGEGETVRVAFAWFAGSTGFLPAESTTAACRHRAKLVDETVPDGTEIAPGQEFTKIWRLQNTGNCPWRTSFAVVHVEGPEMGADPRVPLPHGVQPGEEVEISVTFTAPEAPGTYRSVWMLEDDQGHRFGLGQDAQDRFWVEIVVPATEETLQPGTPTRRDPMENPGLWYLVNEPQAQFEMAGGRLTMYGLQPGALDIWGLSAHPPLKDAYLEGDFITGPECEDRDRYGFIVRAPQPEYGIVVEFACSGEYRVYRWDGRYTELKGWTHAAAIHPGPNQKNTLGVWMEGPVLKVYANRILIGQVEDATFLEGRFGLVVAAGQTAGFRVDVEEVRYWTPLP